MYVMMYFIFKKNCDQKNIKSKNKSNQMVMSVCDS